MYSYVPRNVQTHSIMYYVKYARTVNVPNSNNTN